MIVIRRTKMTAALSEEDILGMLKRCPDVWAEALKRGKRLYRWGKKNNERLWKENGGGMK